MGQKDDKGKSRKIKVLVLLLILVTVIAVGVTIWALLFRDTTSVLAPDYAPVEEDANAEDIEGEDDTEKMEADEGGGAVSMSYPKSVTISLSGQTASLMF